MIEINTPLRTRIRISDTHGWGAGTEGIYLGYNAQYDSVKVGFVDADGNYTGDHTRVPRNAVSVVEETPAQKVSPAPTGNVTITLPAEYAAQVVADLKALRAAYPDLSTPAMHVAKVRLEVALSDLEPTPDFVAVDAARRAADAQIGGALTGDVLDPVETQDAPAPTVVVTRVDDLDPEARYALWVCDLEGSHRCGVKCSAHSMVTTGAGNEIAGRMGMYEHRYAERIG